MNTDDKRNPVVGEAVRQAMQIYTAQGWDSPPNLLFVSAPPGRWVDAMVTPLMFPPFLWEFARPTFLIAQMAKEIREHSETVPALPLLRPPGHEWIGAMMATEAWLLDPDTPQDLLDEAMAWLDADPDRSIADHPAGVEAKIVVAVDRDHNPYLAKQRRDNGHVTFDTFAEHGGVEGAQWEGALHEALCELLDGLVAHPRLTDLDES